MASVVQGKVVSHGAAPYKNDPANSDSYYVELEGDNNESRTLWGVGIRDAIQLKSIQDGEEVAFYDRGLAEGSKKRNWDVERFEKLKSYENSIEEGTAPTAEKTTSLDKAENHSLQRGKYDEADDEEELDLPTSIKNQYIYKIKNRALADEKINFYEREDETGVVAFEDRNKSLHTSREDSKTIKSMLDVAQAKKWSSINLKGTEAFKREAWLEAKVRGIEVKGFKPEEKDLVELQKRQEERSYNQVGVNEERSREINSQKALDATDANVDDKVIDADASNSWDVETVVDDYDLSAHEAEMIIKYNSSRDDFEQSITSFQEEFDTNREQAVKTLGEWAVRYDEEKDIDQKIWDENNRLTGHVEIEDEVKDATKAIAVDASVSTATGSDYTTSSAVASVVEDKLQNEVLAKITEEEVEATRDDVIETQESTTADHEDDKANEMNSYQHIDTEYEKFKDEQGLLPEYNGHREEDLADEQREWQEHQESLAAQAHEESLEMQKAEEEAEIAFGKAEAEMEDFMMQSEFDNLEDFRAFRESQFEEEVQRRVLDITDDELAYRYENMFPNKEYGSELSLMVDYDTSEREAKDSLKEFVAKEELKQGLSIDEARQQIRPHTLSNIIDYEKRFINEVTKDESKEVQELAQKDFEDRLSKVEVLKSADQVEKARDDALLTAENYLEATKQLDADEKEYQAWKTKAMLEQEYELDDDRYRAEYAFAKSVEKEALVRSNEFDVGRDIDPEAEVEGDVEQFHNNLAAPTGAGVSKQAAMQKVEAAFDRKISPTQRNEVKENVEDSLDNRQKIAIEAMRRAIAERFKGDDLRLKEKQSALDEKIPDIAAGKYDIEPLTITENQKVEVQTRDKGSQDKSM